MKRIVTALLLFCLLPGLILYGCAQPASTQDATPAATLSKAPVDFSLSASDLTCGNDGSMSRAYVKAGRKVTLQARVRKNTDGTAAGGKVKFLLDGKQVDCVPFYMDAAEGNTIVKGCYMLPLDQYGGLDKDDETPLAFEARVEPDALHEDTTASNDSAQKQAAVRGDGPAQSAVYADADITAFEASSDAGAGIAKPGTSLKLKIKYTGGSGRTRARYYIDGSLVAEKPYSVSKTGTQRTEYFYVPWDRTDELDCRVVLSGGESARLKVPVERFEYTLHDHDVSWGYYSAGHIVPGQRVWMRCRVHADSRITFGYTHDTLRVVFVVNGEPSDPVKVDPPSGTVPYMGDATYVYDVPEDQSGPLDVKVYADAPGLFDETNEDNNLASATIPSAPEGSGTPGVSIAEGDLWFSPAPIIPGEKVQLMAAIHNDAAGSLATCHRIFTVNGEVLDPNNTRIGRIAGGQYFVTYEMWTVPEGLTSDPQFTVTVDPDHLLSGDDTSDNSATITLPLARPDLTAGDVAGTGAQGYRIISGGEAVLTATVYNKGPVAVTGAKVDFVVDGAVVGTQTVNLPAYGSANVSMTYDVPQMTDNTQTTEEITGVSGSVSPTMGNGTLNFSVKVDPDNRVAESNENNNTAGPVSLSVVIPSRQGRVYVTVQDSGENDVEGASVRISAGGKTCTATTDAHGGCSFYNVPFGPYEAVAEKSGYNQGRTYDETLYEGNLEDYAHICLDNKAQVTGRVTTSGGGGLSGVSVQAEGKDYKTTTDGSGNYTLKLPAGSYTILYRKAGYERKDESVTLEAASSLTKNVTMPATNLAYVYGCVYGQDGKPLAGMKVDAVRTDKSVIVSTTTGADGNYSLDVPLSAPSMDAGIKVSGQGLNAIQGVFLDQGLEERCDISFEPSTGMSGEVLSSVEAKVSPWVVCASMPGTFFNPDYEVEAIYGMFGLDTYIMAEDGVITHLEIDTEPDYWLYSSVSSSWSPTDVFEVGEIAGAAIDVASFIVPTDIPIAMTMHSTNHTKVRIKKVAIVSDGTEVSAVYPNVSGDYAYAPDVPVNWNDCRIKYYLKVDPDNGVANPAAGYGKDRVLIEWNPKTKKFTKIGSYVVTGWDEAHARETYMDE